MQPKRAFLAAPRSAPAVPPAASPFARRTANAGGAGERVVVEVAAPAGAPVDLFAEGPTPDWALPLPEPSGGGARNATLHLRSRRPAPRRACRGATLTFTAVSRDDAIEVPAHLD